MIPLSYDRQKILEFSDRLLNLYFQLLTKKGFQLQKIAEKVWLKLLTLYIKSGY
jgi:hypothetical protein